MNVFIVISGSFGVPEEDSIQGVFSTFEKAQEEAYADIFLNGGSDVVEHNTADYLNLDHSTKRISNGFMTGSRYGFTYNPRYGDVKSYRMIIERNIIN